jgi:hypothetical protein
MSVVVPVRQGVLTAAETLTHLLQHGWLEVIAVVSTQDPTAAVLRNLRARFPELHLIEIDGEFSVPQLRAHGIRAAQGRLVAITEDHCAFSPWWPEVLGGILEDARIGAAGGSVFNGLRGSILDWAVYFSRYSLFLPPIPRGTVPRLPGNNTCYRRDLLESQRAFYENGFWEHEFHRHLERLGFSLFHEPEAWVLHRKPYRFAAYCALRFRHGRCFGGMIRENGSEGSSSASRWPRILSAPLMPFLMAFRSARSVAAKRTRRKEYLLALPLLLIFYAAWTAGEVAGYLGGPGRACAQTD